MAWESRELGLQEGLIQSTAAQRHCAVTALSQLRHCAAGTSQGGRCHRCPRAQVAALFPTCNSFLQAHGERFPPSLLVQEHTRPLSLTPAPSAQPVPAPRVSEVSGNLAWGRLICLAG